MVAFLGAPENIIFVCALVLMILLGCLQAIGLQGSDADVDVDADGTAVWLSWLGIGRLPLMLLLILFLGIFGLIGLLAQQITGDLTGSLLSSWLAVPAVAALALPLTGASARMLAPILPRDHTTAVPLEVLVGRTARIVLGEARTGSPARAQAEDQFGQVHYLMIEPDNPGQIFTEGEQVLIVRREGDTFRAIARGDHHLPSLGA